jgi:hypothetical protein
MVMTLFALAIATVMNGVVLDENAKSIPSAHVYIYTATPKTGVSDVCPSCYIDCGKHTAVDAKGNFKISGLDPTLRFNVLAVADGYEPKFARNVDPAKEPIAIQLRPRSIEDADRLITGIVVDENNKPVVGAVVEPRGYRADRGIGYGAIPGLDLVSITNGKGEFALRMPKAGGKLDVLVTARSLAPTIERMFVPGETKTIHMKTGVTIVGRVEKNGQPVKGVTVALVQQNRASGGYYGITEIGTDAKGNFTLANVAPGEAYYLFTPMRRSREVIAPKLIKAGAEDEITEAGTLRVATRRISGSVVVPEGVSIAPGSRLLFVLKDVGDPAEVELDRDGKFNLEAAAEGELLIEPRILGARLHTTERLPATGDVTNVRLVLQNATR